MLSERNWKLDSVLRLALGIFFCLCVGTLLAALVRGKVDPQTPLSVAQIIISGLTFQGAAIVLTWRFLRENQSTWLTGFGLQTRPIKAVSLGVLACIVFLPAGWGLQIVSIQVMHFLGIEASVQPTLLAMRNSGSTAQLAALGVVVILLAPLAEELLFRGILYPSLKRTGYPQIALWATSSLFALIHFNLAAFLPLLLLALTLTWLYEETDNLVAPITAHVVFNAINFGRFLIDNSSYKFPGQS
ncbi:MAG: CPBP family intramembrane metalloprotease [Verrucomicrobiota bacterium]